MTRGAADRSHLTTSLGSSQGRVNSDLYGIQQQAKIRAPFPFNDPRKWPLLDAPPAKRLWRVSAFGICLFEVVYGTSSTEVMTGLASPMVGYFPGSVQVSALSLEREGDASVTLTPVNAEEGCCGGLRVIADARLSPIDLPPRNAVKFVGLAPVSLLNIFGEPVTAVAGQAVDVDNTTRVSSGYGWWWLRP